MAQRWIANSVHALIQVDKREHLPLERIPPKGDVLGLGTTTSIDNSGLAFLQKKGLTTIYKRQASDVGIRALRSGDGSGHHPYACFTDDATAARTPVAVGTWETVKGGLSGSWWAKRSARSLRPNGPPSSPRRGWSGQPGSGPC